MPNMLAEKIESQYIMFKGEPGTRKSTQALSYPRPQFWFSWDQKMNALRIPMRAWSVNPKEIEFTDYNDWNTARKKLEELQINCPFKTLIIDSVTSMADGALNQSLVLKRGTTRSSGKPAGKTVAGIAVNEMEDYSAEAAAITELMALTKDIKKFHKVNIILIAHVIQAEYKAVDGTVNKLRTIITAGKKVGPKIPAYCEEVYHFNMESGMDMSKGGMYTCWTSNIDDDFARTTLELPRKIEFGEEQLYNKWIKPAIEQMNSDQSQINK